MPAARTNLPPSRLVLGPDEGIGVGNPTTCRVQISRPRPFQSLDDTGALPSRLLRTGCASFSLGLACGRAAPAPPTSGPLVTNQVGVARLWRRSASGARRPSRLAPVQAIAFSLPAFTLAGHLRIGCCRGTSARLAPPPKATSAAASVNAAIAYEVRSTPVFCFSSFHCERMASAPNGGAGGAVRKYLPGSPPPLAAAISASAACSCGKSGRQTSRLGLACRSSMPFRNPEGVRTTALALEMPGSRMGLPMLPSSTE